MSTKLTGDQVIDLVKEAGLDWHAGFGLNEENRYGALVELAFNLGRAPSQQAVAVGEQLDRFCNCHVTKPFVCEGCRINEIRRATPPAATARVPMSEQFATLTDDQRMDLFRKFCTSCGSNDPGCQCWNEE